MNTVLAKLRMSGACLLSSGFLLFAPKGCGGDDSPPTVVEDGDNGSGEGTPDGDRDNVDPYAGTTGTGTTGAGGTTGNGTGWSTSGGSTNGGANGTTGASTTGGGGTTGGYATNGGSATTGGNSTGWSTSGGSTNGGAGGTTGISTTGGVSTTGGNTGGNSTGWSTSGGSTNGGATTAGSTSTGGGSSTGGTTGSTWGHPSGASVSAVVSAGSGCSPNTVAAQLGAGGTLQLSGPALSAQAGPGIPIPQARRNCAAIVTVAAPDGYSFAVAGVHAVGQAQLASGISSLVGVTTHFAGSLPQSVMEESFSGPLTQGVMLHKTVATSDLVWSACTGTRQLDVNAQARVDRSAAASGVSSQVLGDVASGVLNQTVSLVWRTCP